MWQRYQTRKLISSSLFSGHKHTLIGWIVLACLLVPLFSACVSPSTSTSTIPGTTATSASGTSGGATPTTSSGTSGGVTPTAAASGVVPLNIDITYSSVDTTIVDLKQAKTFPDDTYTSTSAVLRLDLKETNSSSNTAYNSYDNYRLLFPDGTNVQPLNEKDGSAIASSISRTNWIDYPVPLTTKGTQLTLQLGKASEAQELIPLTAGADVSKYAAKTVTPNAKMTYGKIDWTVTKATSELSYGGKQADKGNMFVVVELSADNTSSSSGGGDLVGVRLKSGSTESPAQESLNGVEANQTNVKSTQSFVMPQGSTNFTLIFLPSNAYGITTQSTVDFQIA